MLSKKALAGIAVVAVILLVAAFAFSGSDGPDARYDYEVELTDTFVNENGFIERPTDGMQWAILSYTVTNDGYYPYVSTNPMTWEWELTVHGITYTYSMDTYSHPGYVLSEVDNGETGSQTLVYSIPSSVVLSDITISQEYIIGSPDLERDGNVKVEKVTMQPQTFRYDHSLKFISDSELGPYDHPDSGMRYLQVSFTVVNDSVTEGVGLGASNLEWSVLIGGLRYEASIWDSISAPGYSDAKVVVGGTGSSVAIIEVPIGSIISDMQVILTYGGYSEPLAIHDGSLL